MKETYKKFDIANILTKKFKEDSMDSIITAVRAIEGGNFQVSKALAHTAINTRGSWTPTLTATIEGSVGGYNVNGLIIPNKKHLTISIEGFQHEPFYREAVPFLTGYGLGDVDKFDIPVNENLAKMADYGRRNITAEDAAKEVYETVLKYLETYKLEMLVLCGSSVQ